MILIDSFMDRASMRKMGVARGLLRRVKIVCWQRSYYGLDWRVNALMSLLQRGKVDVDVEFLFFGEMDCWWWVRACFTKHSKKYSPYLFKKFLFFFLIYFL
jgi:hypothetical protein